MVVVVLVVRGVEVNVGKGMRSKYGAKLICTSCGERAIDVADGGSMMFGIKIYLCWKVDLPEDQYI